MSKHNIENRNIEIRSFDISNDPSSRQVSGYAVVFNSVSQVLYDKKRNLFFREIISPEAITQDLLESSDIVMNYGHNDDLILARSKNGTGTLSVSLDEKGLYFSFDMPDTALGNQIRESIQRGDITSCSFAFRSNDKDDIWDNDGDIPTRTICSIIGLYDCAIVVHPAYEETEVSARSLEKIQELQYMKKEDIELREDDVKDPEEEEKKEETKEEDPKEAPKDEEKSEDEEDNEEDRSEEEPEEEEKSDEEDPEKEKEDEKDPEEERNLKVSVEKRKINTKNLKTMEKRFSLIKAIRDAANHVKFDEASQAVIDAGKKIMNRDGQTCVGSIQIPISEFRDDDPVHYTVEADGEHVVVTDYLNILEPLRAENVLVAAGANFMTGLSGDVKLPIGTDVNVFWEGETTQAKNGAGSFSSLVMQPKRIAAVVPISLQMLAQDTLGVENYIRNLLATKINSKIEETILGELPAEGKRPAGIFYNVDATEVTDFKDICDLESDLDDNNIKGKRKYIVSPKAKSYLRSTIKGTNATGMIMEDDEVDGTPALETTNMTTYKFAVGSWENLYIGIWGALDIKIDDVTWFDQGLIRLMVNAFVDYKVVRDGAIVYGEVANDDSSEG